MGLKMRTFKEYVTEGIKPDAFMLKQKAEAHPFYPHLKENGWKYKHSTKGENGEVNHHFIHPSKKGHFVLGTTPGKFGAKETHNWGISINSKTQLVHKGSDEASLKGYFGNRFHLNPKPNEKFSVTDHPLYKKALYRGWRYQGSSHVDTTDLHSTIKNLHDKDKFGVAYREHSSYKIPEKETVHRFTHPNQPGILRLKTTDAGKFKNVETETGHLVPGTEKKLEQGWSLAKDHKSPEKQAGNSLLSFKKYIKKKTDDT